MKVRNVCDKDDVLGFDESFTWSNTSGDDCLIEPGEGWWPFVDDFYSVTKHSTAGGKTLKRPPLAKNRTKYIYNVTGGGCPPLETNPKNVLIP